MQSIFKSKYYDHPDGEDAIGKAVVTNKYALGTALGWASIDVLMISHPKGYLPTISRYLYFTGPAMGMATAFTIGTYMSTRMRGKNDKLNYVIGGCAAGGVFGAWQRNAVLGLMMCGVFSIAGCIKKLSLEEGWEFFPQDAQKKHGYGSLRGVTHDFTLMADRERGWTTGK